MAACSICGTTIAPADVISGKYKKRDGQTICLKCDAVSVPRPATAKPVARPAAVAAAARPTTAPSGGGSAKPPAPPARPADPAKARPAAASSRPAHHYQPTQGLDPAVKMGMIIAGVVFAVAAVVLGVIITKHKNEDAATQAKLKASRDGVESVIKLRAENPDNFEAILAKIEEVKASKAVLEGRDEGELNQIYSQTVSAKGASEIRKRNQEALALCLKDADDKDKIDETVKNIEALSDAAGGMEPEFIKKVSDLSLKIHTNAVNFAMEKLDKYVKENPKDFRGILDRFKTTLMKLDEMKKQGGEVLKLAAKSFKDLKTQEDDYAVQYWNTSADKFPWINLLDSNNSPKWTKAGPVEITFENGQMHVKSTVGAGSKEGRGLVLSGKKDYWIDFDVDFEVEVKSGGFVVVGRYSDSQHSFQLNFETGGEGNPIQDGKTYKVHVISLGKEASINVEGIELSNSRYDMPHSARSGAFGFGVTPGGEAVFKSMKARVVRAD